MSVHSRQMNTCLIYFSSVKKNKKQFAQKHDKMQKESCWPSPASTLPRGPWLIFSWFFLQLFSTLGFREHRACFRLVLVIDSLFFLFVCLVFVLFRCILPTTRTIKDHIQIWFHWNLSNSSVLQIVGAHAPLTHTIQDWRITVGPCAPAWRVLKLSKKVICCPQTHQFSKLTRYFSWMWVIWRVISENNLKLW